MVLEMTGEYIFTKCKTLRRMKKQKYYAKSHETQNYNSNNMKTSHQKTRKIQFKTKNNCTVEIK